jgi:ABC-type multidrug transport system ATPase subunit
MRGTLLRVDTPAGLRRRGGSATTRVELGGARDAESFLTTLAGLPFVTGAQAADHSLLVEVRDPAGDNPDLVSALVRDGARIVAVREESASLEDVYLSLVGEAGKRDTGAMAAAAAASVDEEPV